MVNRLMFAVVLVAVACGALILRDLSKPIDAPESPSAFLEHMDTETPVGHETSDNPYVAVQAPTDTSENQPSSVPAAQVTTPELTGPTEVEKNRLIDDRMQAFISQVMKRDAQASEQSSGSQPASDNVASSVTNTQGPGNSTAVGVTSPIAPSIPTVNSDASTGNVSSAVQEQGPPPTLLASNTVNRDAPTSNSPNSNPTNNSSANNIGPANGLNSATTRTDTPREDAPAVIGPAAAAPREEPDPRSRFAPPPPSPYETDVAAINQNAAEDNGARVSFGGGAVQLTAPWDWRVYEVSQGREVRLVLTPQEMKNRSSQVDGLWVVCHALRNGLGDKLPALLNKRVNAATRGIVVAASPSVVQVGRFQGVRQEIAHQNSVGFHVLIRTNWGICEVHARTANPKVTKGLLDSILKTIEIGEVAQAEEVRNDKVAAAAELIGSWKAYRSRFRLSGDGRIEIEPEASAVRALGEADAEAPKVLRGDFEARDDLLFVRWDDGSFLNFRWRLDGDSLLLTDHDGRISELRLLLE